MDQSCGEEQFYYDRIFARVCARDENDASDMNSCPCLPKHTKSIQYRVYLYNEEEVVGYLSVSE